MNKGAGRADWLIVTLRLEDGEEMAFIVDTGAPGALFDSSLASKLKRLPLGKWTVATGLGKEKSAIYWEPPLFLGNPRLKTGRLCATFDLSGISEDAGRPIMGVLGMDCLKHYCIQLDFRSGTLRFLDDTHLDAAKLGQPFPLEFSLFRKLYIRRASLAGGRTGRLVVDTGDNGDGQSSIEGNEAKQLHLSRCIWA